LHFEREAAASEPVPSLSYLLTSDEHMNYVAKQADKSKPKPKCRNNKSVVASDKKTVK